MAPPYPPQGEQKQHTERPLKVYAEQYLAGQPLPIGVVLNVGDPPFFPENKPRVPLPGGPVVEIQLTEWVISNRYTGQPIEVISNEEMAERFGGQADTTEENP